LKSRQSIRRLYAGAVRDHKAGNVLLKVVNAAPYPVETSFRLQGLEHLSSTNEALVLTSSSLSDENSLDDPTRVSPKKESFSVAGPNFQHVFPGNSFTVLRMGVK
jgi:alpha-L-arabinofuranosidase